MIKKNFLLLPFLFLSLIIFGQTANNNLSFEKGQIYEINSKINTGIQQDMMGRKMEVLVSGTILHDYEVTAVSADSISFFHKTKRITLTMDGMNQKINFDSDNKKDAESEIGKAMKNNLQDTYSMTIDRTGMVLYVQTNVAKGKKGDASEFEMFKPLLAGMTSSLEAPKKEDASIFKILPAKEISKGLAWVDANEKEKKKTTFAIADITETDVMVSYKSEYPTESKGNIMGMETFTNLENSESGKIVLNKNSGVLKSKTSITTSTGNVNVMGQSIPIVSAANTETTIILK